LFACGVHIACERSFEEACGETEVGRRPLPPLLAPEPRPLLPLAPRTRPAGTKIEPQLEPATSTGVILSETGQFLLLCLLQLWQRLQRCRQTRARVPLFLIHFTSVLRKQLAANDTFLREANSYKRALALRNSRQGSNTTAPSSVYIKHVIRLVSWADTDDFPVSSLSCDRQQFVKFRGTMQTVTGIHAGWAVDGLARHAVDVCLPIVGHIPYTGGLYQRWQ